ncbi:ribonucleoside hydrolase RihC [Tetragenococcus muriaticus]|uniref:ribonucleoside hydrolase RihC n=1 Tax=Tetragenococcus muriaticus TaxID=64642 RepID=UPI00041F28CA|nr:ribonucleoside hydrolase RihC [Tetragenococcus muriaticus]
MTKRKVIIDTDPGIDDAAAMAIMLFSEQVEVPLITTVTGNVSLDKTTYNALRLLPLFGKEVPVAKGADHPLLREPVDASDVHGETGMDGYDFPEPNEDLLLNETAVEAMYRVIMESDEPITLMPIGPMTNVALLLREHPDVKENIQEIVSMGGSTSRGNIGIYSEFNYHVDPEAAKIVYESGLPITMAGLNIGDKALLYIEDLEKLQKANPVGDMLYHIFLRYRSGDGKVGLRIYDAYAAGYILNPEMYTTQKTFVGIETKGEFTSGASAADLGNSLGRTHNANVLVDVDGEGFKEWFVNSIKNLS